MTLRRSSSVPKFSPQKDLELKWDNFNGGWNVFSKPTELRPNELAQADNCMLIGVGTPTGRWGSEKYNLAGSGRIRILDAYYNSSTSTNILLSVTDLGYLTKKNGASYTIIPGASFPSGSLMQSVELAGNTYIATASLNFIRFDGTNLIPYVGLSAPTNVSTAVVSAASGFNTYSWIITANTISGETVGSVNKILASLPLDLTTTTVKVSWDSVSSAPSILTGYNIYRGKPGNETYIASVDPSATQYTDKGTPQSDTIFPPLTNRSAGPRARYIIRHDDRLVLAGIQGDSSLVLISGRYPYHDRFSAIDGGGYCYVSPNDGDDITGLEVQNLQTTTPLIVVYKQNTTHVITLDTITLGNFVILDPKVHLLTSSSGASNGDTVKRVENDIYSFGRRGLYSTGQEPQFLNQIRTNEISSRIRPYVQSLSDTDFKEANAAYIDYKYVLSFPTKRETIIYDHQRNAFMGPWKTPFGITKWFLYYDPTGIETWLAGCDDGYVRQFSPAYISDSGVAVSKSLRTARTDMGSWNMMKFLNYAYFLFRNIRGSVTLNVLLEDRSGNTTVQKTATITSSLNSSGWGSDTGWGDTGGAMVGGGWGQTDSVVVLTGSEIARYVQLYKQFRVVQFEIITSASNANFELLSIRAISRSLGPASLPTTLKL